MKRQGILWVLLLLLASSLIGGCALSKEGADVLTYSGVTEVSVAPGEFVPGTRIQYVGQDEQGARVLIDGQELIRKLGDSLIWEGKVTDGVDLKVKLRVLHIAEKRLVTSGLVTLRVHHPNPQPAAVDESRPVRYTLPVTYKVSKGKCIPGTLVCYEGPEEGKGARLSGVEGYPYRALGDSILWQGTLLPNADLSLNVRVLFYNDSFLQVLGTATVGVTP